VNGSVTTALVWPDAAVKLPFASLEYSAIILYPQAK
jgi:hypothetical protein